MNEQLHHLIRMANQIAANVAPGQDENAAAEATASHIRRFWSPLMRRRIVEYADTDDNALLEPVALAAVRRCAQEKR